MVNAIKQLGSALTLAATTLCLSINAQQKNENFTKALETFKGISNDMTEAQAFNVIRNAAANDSNAYAMNVTGIAYMARKGTAKDSTLAVYWMEQAGRHGYRNAYNNLGMLFKNKKRATGQDFAKAVEYFTQRAKQGAVAIIY